MGIFNNNLKRKRRRRKEVRGLQGFIQRYPRLVVYRAISILNAR